MFNKYYQDELTFLRELGREFSQAHPDTAHLLADRGSDPDVERLLEGFAFLTGRLRQKIDDELPEVTHSIMSLLWPHYLRPIPSMTLMQFVPARGSVRERMLIPRGTEVDSIPVEGTSCRFRTCYDVQLDPAEVADAALENPGSGAYHLRIRFKAAAGLKNAQLKLDSMRLFLAGEPQVTSTLYLLLSRHVAQVDLVGLAGGRPLATATLPPDAIRMAGFSDQEALLPYPTHAFPGFRILQEYFAFPQKFLFFDITGLKALAEVGGDDQFDVIIRLTKPPITALRVSAENFRPGCAPAVNLFARDADPIRVEHDKTEYLVRAAGKDPAHYEIFSVDTVLGFEKTTAEPRTYPSFFQFLQSPQAAGARKDALYHYARLKPAVVGDGTETYLSFYSAGGESLLPPTETISVRLTCTNRRLPRALRVGDVSVATVSSPEFARFRNISNVMGSVAPPLAGDLQWRLISHMSLSYSSLATVESLRSILSLYNFQALYDRQAARENELRLEAIREVSARQEDTVYRGTAVRGLATTIDLVEPNFAGEGDMVLFGNVLDHFLGLYASLNSYSRLTIRGVQSGEIYRWSPRLGQQTIL